MSNITTMTKKLFVLLIVFLGMSDKVVAQNPPCPICPPETPQLNINGSFLYISLALAIIMGFALFRKKISIDSKKA